MGRSLLLCLFALGCAVDTAGLKPTSDGRMETPPDAGRSGDGSRSGADGGPRIDGGAETDAGTSPDGGRETTDGGTIPDGARCAPDPSPPGGDVCPDRCNGGCAGNVCTIECTDSKRCSSVVCPLEYACLVRCEGGDACDNGSVTCPPDHACTLVCGPGHDACGDLAFHCGTASCSIECTDDACNGAAINCGSGACTASCGATPRPTIDACESSCACEGC